MKSPITPNRILSRSKPGKHCNFLIAGMLAAGSITFGLFAPPVHAGNHGGGSPTPLAISEFRTLEFGEVSSTTSGSGTVTVTSGGGKSTTGFAVDMGGSHRAAEFKVTGPNNQAITITLPASVQISNGSSTITLDSFTSTPSGTATLSNKGKLTIYVGARATIPSGQSANDYTGTYTIFVDEQ